MEQSDRDRDVARELLAAVLRPPDYWSPAGGSISNSTM